ncbi:acyl-CoA synthetase [Streptomyces viridiviolaceus]|uniref:AMP-binding protein n=1 Tax=Streptomyces viridiviolaceus TaxID=68282 RepID=A0ABW2EFP4_9ACTN|nr:AMP-binding protein [Streptomyces viridiviolaceus]GHB73837.1 acyl-CoA synthetase [Streptomyces viridiviolaceus]
MRHDQEYASIPNAVRRAADRFGDAAAVIDGAHRWSFRELAERMTHAVRAALALGIGPGDRVALCAPNSAEWIVAALGVQGAGGIVVPLNTRFKPAELAYVLRASAAKALFAAEFLGTDYVAELRRTAPDVPTLRSTVSLLGPRGSPDLAWDDFLDAGSSVAEAEAHAAIDRLTPDQVCDIMFTSGTTGHPKGVILTHGQSLRLYGWLGHAYGYKDSDISLIVPPFFHCFGSKAGWLTSLLHGVTVVPAPVFEPRRTLELVSEEKVTVLSGPPTLFQDLIDCPDRARYDLSSLRFAMTGATTIPESLIHAMRDELSFEVVMSAYGLTEASALVTTTRVDDAARTVARTTGRAIPDVEVRIVDPTGRVLLPGQPGEVVMRGYTMTRGYWQDPDATAALIDRHGWLYTGDVGCLDADGNLSIIDRIKDMYISGGFNVYPTEVERLLQTCESVEQVSVVGVPDLRLGEVGCAFIVPRPDRRLTEEQVVAWARDNMANFKVPRYIRFVEQLPRNASHKVLKHRLRAEFTGAGAPSPASAGHRRNG